MFLCVCFGVGVQYRDMQSLLFVNKEFHQMFLSSVICEGNGVEHSQFALENVPTDLGGSNITDSEVLLQFRLSSPVPNNVPK